MSTKHSAAGAVGAGASGDIVDDPAFNIAIVPDDKPRPRQPRKTTRVPVAVAAGATGDAAPKKKAPARAAKAPARAAKAPARAAKAPARAAKAPARSVSGGKAPARSARTKAPGAPARSADGDTESEPESTEATSDDDSIDELNKKATKEEAEDEVDLEDSDVEDSDEEDVFDDFVPTGETWSEEPLGIRHVYVDAEERCTVGVLGIHAAAALISIRTAQIAATGLTTVDDTDCDTNEDIARKELRLGMLPIMVRRTSGVRVVDGEKRIEYELWRTNELELPSGI